MVLNRAIAVKRPLVSSVYLSADGRFFCTSRYNPIKPGAGGAAESSVCSTLPTTAYYRSIVMLIGGAATLIAAIAIGVVVTVMNSRESALVGSERELANTAFLLSKDIDQKIGELESIRTIIAEDVKSGKITSVEEFNREMSSEDIGLHLKHRIEAFSFIDNLAIINSSGIIVGASSGRDSLGIQSRG